jgi:hypothetical protein
MRKPSGDLGDMQIGKAKAAETVPFATTAPASVAGPPKGLTVKLDGEQYAALRAYAYERERTTGKRLTHQEIMVRALAEFLAKEAGA